MAQLAPDSTTGMALSWTGEGFLMLVRPRPACARRFAREHRSSGGRAARLAKAVTLFLDAAAIVAHREQRVDAEREEALGPLLLLNILPQLVLGVLCFVLRPPRQQLLRRSRFCRQQLLRLCRRRSGHGHQRHDVGAAWPGTAPRSRALQPARPGGGEPGRAAGRPAPQRAGASAAIQCEVHFEVGGGGSGPAGPSGWALCRNSGSGVGAGGCGLGRLRDDTVNTCGVRPRVRRRFFGPQKAWRKFEPVCTRFEPEGPCYMPDNTRSVKRGTTPPSTRCCGSQSTFTSAPAIITVCPTACLLPIAEGPGTGRALQARGDAASQAPGEPRGGRAAATE
jgi:hypothetical protein